MEFTEGLTFNTPVEIFGYPLGTYGTRVIEPGTEVKVTRVYAHSVHVRGVTTRGDERTFSVPKSQFEGHELVLDPDAPTPRKLGETPEGGISPEDPRLAWLWEDAAKYADQRNFCSEYDKLADALGIPGRERKFTVNREVNGFKVSKSFTARSKKQAEGLFDAELSTLVVPA